MARKRFEQRVNTAGDDRYQDAVVEKLIAMVMNRGKRTTAERIVYGAFDILHDKTGEEAVKIFHQALDNVKPRLEVKSRRVGGATYQVPMEVSGKRQRSLALRWIIQYSRARRGSTMRQSLANELLDAFNRQGAAIKKRDDTHKMAQANKAFAHYRW